MQKTKVKNLKLGVNIFQGEHILETPKSDGLLVVQTDDQLNEFRSKYGELEITIDRDQPWHSVFVIKDWVEETKLYRNNVKKSLDEWKKTKKTIFR